MKPGVDRFTKLGLSTVADSTKVAKSTLRAVQRNKREVRLPRRMAVNAALNGLSTKLFEAFQVGIDVRKDGGKTPFQ